MTIIKNYNIYVSKRKRENYNSRGEKNNVKKLGAIGAPIHNLVKYN